ncbi:MAG: hypothetical protein WD077_01295 [Bacteroidia bacterium]
MKHGFLLLLKWIYLGCSRSSLTSNQWSNSGSLSINNKTNFGYDPNGNILKLMRNAVYVTRLARPEELKGTVV